MPKEIDASDDVPERRGVYLLTHPRSASNLFQTMMSKQPGYQNSSYQLFKAGFATLGQLERGSLSEWPEEDRKALYDIFQEGWEGLQDEVADAKKNGKQVFIKDHTLFLRGPDKWFSSLFPADTSIPSITLHERTSPDSTPHTNPTSLPDSFLLSMQPVFQIRHPALMFPSFLRVQSKGQGLAGSTDRGPTNVMIQSIMTLTHSRALYDWYLAHSPASSPPRVIDADDIMNDPAAVAQLCDQTGLSKDDVLYEWEERNEEDPLKAAFLSTIYASKGIVKGKDAKGISIEEERGKWVEEWGEKDASGLEELIRGAMGDYEYLWGRRTKSV